MAKFDEPDRKSQPRNGQGDDDDDENGTDLVRAFSQESMTRGRAAADLAQLGQLSRLCILWSCGGGGFELKDGGSFVREELGTGYREAEGRRLATIKGAMRGTCNISILVYYYYGGLLDTPRNHGVLSWWCRMLQAAQLSRMLAPIC